MNRILLAASALAAVPAHAQTAPPQPTQPVAASPGAAPPVAKPVVPPAPVPPPMARHRHVPSAAELRVRTANAKAIQEPATPAFVNAVQVYPFGEGVLYHQAFDVSATVQDGRWAVALRNNGTRTKRVPSLRLTTIDPPVARRQLPRRNQSAKVGSMTIGLA
ncbi:hypothetical protein RZN05_11935 [Sphingomonas sp. HF-S4]|uniref:Uncharacterized protein n=1 Tax=Sphingomonas agrestis TaxID=3080540 RepID=A0ABU3Y8U2_9SPHN|nr:hypothetical protein [Sphingomonas sp. HF-S4]MDV3457697.1 hypothetical protein [Sphingomonas sp. HF-S4]